MTQQLHSSVGKYEDICPHKKLYADVHSSIAPLTENGKQAECSSSTVEQKNKIWSIHTMEECAIIKWMEYYYSRQHGWILETLWSAKEASHKSPNSVWFHLHEMSGIGKSTEAESRSVVARAGEMEGKRGVTDMGTGLLPGVTHIFCNCGGWLLTSVTILKASNCAV